MRFRVNPPGCPGSQPAHVQVLPEVVVGEPVLAKSTHEAVVLELRHLQGLRVQDA